jgi:hypothetical protein
MRAIAILLGIGVAACTLAHAKSVKRAPSGASLDERVAFYVQRLGDRRYVEYRSDEGARIAWYVAAEELGLIGVAAIPPLVEQLKKSTDVYERQQIFYALRLAVQNPNAESSVGEGFPMPTEALAPPETHEKLKADWLKWWEEHGKAVTAAAAIFSSPLLEEAR